MKTTFAFVKFLSSNIDTIYTKYFLFILQKSYFQLVFTSVNLPKNITVVVIYGVEKFINYEFGLVYHFGRLLQPRLVGLTVMSN